MSDRKRVLARLQPEEVHAFLTEPMPIGPNTSTSAVALPVMLDRLKRIPEPSWFVRELIPDEGIVMWHGRPRSMKSLSLDSVLLSLALGDEYAFGNSRFAIPRRRGVILLSEEDPERIRASRLRMLLAARGVGAPEAFHLLIRRGWNLETPEDQAALLAAVEEVARKSNVVPEVLAIDPVRASMPGIDGGPRDAFPGREFLGRIFRETQIKVVHLVAHDTKPKDATKDDRPRAERASGGLIFSIADCPIGFERVNDCEAVGYPSSYKFSNDPKPFRLRFESASPEGQPFQDFLRVVATDIQCADTMKDNTSMKGAEERVLAFLSANPWSTTQEIEDGLGGKVGAWSQVLRRLKDKNKVAMVTGDLAKTKGRSKNAKLWGLP